ncbi:MAG: aldo/keto reductase [Planctomycetaceae bacterium]|nr:aldo/keto reductase [Planctomycetaceae bacterium]
MPSRRPLGSTGLEVCPIGFGAFKIGRNEKTKYPGQYALPTDEESGKLLHAVLDLGINWIDTAPAYGLSEERVGRHLASRRDEVVLSTKVGEDFEQGESRYDFSADAMQRSIDRSLKRLRTDLVDILFLHVRGDDVETLQSSDAVAVLKEAKAAGKTRAIGLSPKTIEAARLALDWADVLMVEFHLQDQSFAPVIAEAAQRGIGVVVKKGLASGHLPPSEAVRFVLSTVGVAGMTIGSLNVEHLRQNLEAVPG